MNTFRNVHPSLPGLFQLPLKIIPDRIRYPTIKRALNTLFEEALSQGELDFLIHKTININIEDASLCFNIYLQNGRLNIGSTRPDADLSISGKLYAFLMLGTRKEDADTLFFRRLLKSEGDTELGLFVKNFLDGLEPQTLPAFRVMDACMNGALNFADRAPALIDRLPTQIQRIIETKTLTSN